MREQSSRPSMMRSPGVPDDIGVARCGGSGAGSSGDSVAGERSHDPADKWNDSAKTYYYWEKHRQDRATRTMAVQSMVTYTRWRASPRFEPLRRKEDGAYEI